MVFDEFCRVNPDHDYCLKKRSSPPGPEDRNLSEYGKERPAKSQSESLWSCISSPKLPAPQVPVLMLLVVTGTHRSVGGGCVLHSSVHE